MESMKQDQHRQCICQKERPRIPLLGLILCPKDLLVSPCTRWSWQLWWGRIRCEGWEPQKDLGKVRTSVQIHLRHQHTMPVGWEGSGQDAPYPSNPHQRNTLLGLQSSAQHKGHPGQESEFGEWTVGQMLSQEIISLWCSLLQGITKRTATKSEGPLIGVTWAPSVIKEGWLRRRPLWKGCWILLLWSTKSKFHSWVGRRKVHCGWSRGGRMLLLPLLPLEQLLQGTAGMSYWSRGAPCFPIWPPGRWEGRSPHISQALRKWSGQSRDLQTVTPHLN